LPATAIEHVLAMSLVLIAIVSSAVAMAHVSYYGVSLTVEGTAANAYAVQEAIFTHLSGACGLNCIDADRLDELSTTYQLAQPSLFKTYSAFLSELKLEDVEFHLWATSGLNVSATWVNSTVSINVFQPFSQRGISAGLTVYVFDGIRVLETLTGETNVQGTAVIQPTADGAVFIFASRGTSVGFTFLPRIGIVNAAEATGVYVRGGQILPQAHRPSSYFILSKDGYTGPLSSGAVAVSAYGLPVAIVWKESSLVRVLTYPHFPIDYGAPVSSTAFTLTTVATVEGSIVKVKLQVWGSGGEFH
jgi:hypothetical protein